MQQKLFQNFLATRSWGFFTAQTTPKFEKIYILYIYREYLLFLVSNAIGSFRKNILIL